MLTFLTVEEYVQARQVILASSTTPHLAWGIGNVVRSFGLRPDKTITFSQGDCRAWVNGILVVGGIVATVMLPGVSTALGVAGSVLRQVVTGGGMGGLLGAVAGPVLCSGLPSTGDSPPVIGPQDVGTPRTPDNPSGVADEGDGFTAFQVDGPATVIMQNTDGTSVTVTTDGNGKSTVTNNDSQGNPTDVTTYDAQGNSSDETEGDPPSTDGGGYPTPDGDGGSGPFGPAAFIATILAEPVGQTAGAGARLTGRGTTFLISGGALIGGRLFNDKSRSGFNGLV